MTVRSPRFLVALFALAVLAAGCNLPDLQEEMANSPALAETSFLYADDHSLITRFHAEQDRTVVPLKKIPQEVRNAVIAVEDQRFYSHGGIDFEAIVRAAAENASAGDIVQGGSTISEQYVKNLIDRREDTLDRKIDEAALAWQLEQEFTKDQILGKYLNTVYFGHGAYGIKAAAQTYFSKEPAQLKLHEAAMLAGVIRAPSSYDPLAKRHKPAIERRNTVLDLMLGQGLISQKEHDAAAEKGLKLKPEKTQDKEYFAPYFVDYVKRWFLANPKFGATYEERYDQLFSGGLRIYTTLDPRMQRAAEAAVNSTLSQASDPSGALTAVDPRTGEIKAMVGGRDYYARNDEIAKLNLATGGSTGRQAGSAFKPFVLVAALEAGFEPSKTYNAPGCIDIKEPEWNKPWHVCNAEPSSYGNLTIQQATVGSVNTVFAQMVMDVGPENAVKVAHRMGIRCCVGPNPRNYPVTQPSVDLQPVPSAVLGAEEVNTLEMASAYGTLATGGFRVTPTPVTRITDSDGRVLYDFDPEFKQVIDPEVAGTAVDILKGVVSGGTGTAANIGRPQFGKTGTAQNYSDAWFVGAIPQMATAVWVGFPEGQKSMCCTRIGTVFGGTWPAQIWNRFMSKATKGMPKEDFPKEGVRYVKVEVDVSRDCLPNKYTPPGLIKRVTYIKGQEPKRKCDQPTDYQQVIVPSVIGMSKQRAKTELSKNGFDTRVLEERSSQPKGYVISQSPAAGEELRSDKKVTLVISKGEKKA